MVARTDILVLGAGLQGAGVALELARRGIAVTLVDAEPRALHRASLRNEGKIHLGLVYANDPTLRSALLQLEGALRFRSILARWIGRSADRLALSTAFHYLVERESIVPAARLAEHYAAVEEQLHKRLGGDPRLDYLGERPARLVRPVPPREIAARYDGRRVVAGFATGERAIDTERLAASLRRALARSPNVRFLASHRVRTLAGEADGFRAEGDGVHGAWRARCSQVVNATWEKKFAFDQQLGIPPPAHLLHRLKYRVIARLPAELRGAPSATLVLGRYGDVVVRGDGTAYLSWYPAGLRGWSHDVEPPAAWDTACRGEAAPALAREIARETLSGIASWLPGVRRCEVLHVDAGAIVAIGCSDVDDAASLLHGRAEIGVQSRGGYHSVSTGKLTTAPLFALEAADRVEALKLGLAAAS